MRTYQELYIIQQRESIMVHITRLCVVMIFTSWLVACGGGSPKDTTAPTTTASVSGGTYNTIQSVRLACDDGDGSGCDKTYYTTDATDPDTNSAIFSGVIEISDTTTLKFFSVDKDGNAESVITQIYVIDTVAPTTTANPVGGTYADVQLLSLSCDDGEGTGCEKVYYTTDTSEPTTSSDVYSSAISISVTTTLKYFAVDGAGNSEAIKAETYVIDTLAPTTTASPVEGAYNQAQSVTLNCNDGDGSGCAATYYTIDNSEPSTTSTPYSSAIDVSTTTTIKFFSVDKVGLEETVRSTMYTIDAISPMVSASQPTDTYQTQIAVELICSDTGGAGCDKVYYTTDGTDPTTSSSLYSAALIINIDTALTFRATDKAGNISDVVQTKYKFRPLVGAVYPSNGQNWNDYVRNDGVDRLHATDVACLPTDSGCIHSGELRVFEVPSGDCSGLEAEDFHDVFRWRCIREGDKAYFMTAGFKRNRHLSNLINWSLLTPDWIDNSVTVLKGVEYQFQTASNKWWNNPVEEVTGAALSASGTIYVVSGDIAEDELVSADRVALVIKPGVTLSASVDINAVVSAIGHNFLWIEGRIDAATQVYGVDISGNYNVLRDLNVANATDIGIRVSGAHWNRLTAIMATNNGNNGIQLVDVENSVIENVLTGNNGNVGFAIPVATTGSDRNVLISLTTMNNFHGIGIPGSAKDNFLSNITAVNNSSSGMRFFGELNSTNIIQNLASVNNSLGLELTGRLDGTLSSFIFNNVVSTNNTTYGIEIGFGPSNAFHGWLKLGNNLQNDCAVNALNPDPGLTPVNCSAVGDSTFVLSKEVTSKDSFIGKVTADDTQNQSDTNGLSSFDLITDWLSFENRFRGWGLNTSPFPSADHRGQCLSGSNCRIWDWSATTGDLGDNNTPVLLGVNDVPTGDNWLVHTWKVLAGETDCAAIAGAVWDGVDTCTTTFLKNAVERIGDFIGNDNGFCESDETCYYTPNIGAYQGHNTFGSVDGFADGHITNVSLKQNSVNGR